MGRFYDAIDDDLRAFVEAQPLFLVATAPLAAEGRVNLSPKGLDCLRVLGPHQVAFLDLTGSGAETAAHLAENGRITIMLCAFAGPPRIVRLSGRGESVLPADPRWQDLAPRFPSLPGARQVVLVEVDKVQSSCGFGVPLFELVGPREILVKSAEAKGEEKLAAYRIEHNSRSIDGLPTPFAAPPAP